MSEPGERGHPQRRGSCAKGGLKHRSEVGGVLHRDVLGEASGGFGLLVEGRVGSADAPGRYRGCRARAGCLETLGGGLERTIPVCWPPLVVVNVGLTAVFLGQVLVRLMAV
jgi:hypothetical protein